MGGARMGWGGGALGVCMLGCVRAWRAAAGAGASLEGSAERSPARACVHVHALALACMHACTHSRSFFLSLTPPLNPAPSAAAGAQHGPPGSNVCRHLDCSPRSGQHRLDRAHPHRPLLCGEGRLGGGRWGGGGGGGKRGDWGSSPMPRTSPALDRSRACARVANPFTSLLHSRLRPP